MKNNCSTEDLKYEEIKCFHRTKKFSTKIFSGQRKVQKKKKVKKYWKNVSSNVQS